MSDQNLAARSRSALDAGEGILRLAPTWVPRSFLMPGGRLKLARQDLYALGTHRGGIDERWFASTTAAANEDAPARRGAELRRPRRRASSPSRTPSAAHGAEMIGEAMWDNYKKWPVYTKFFDNLGPDPPPHAPEPGAGRHARPRGQARELLLPAPAQLDRQQLPLHLLRPRAGHDEGRPPQVPRALERGRQRHPRPLQGLSPEARHRLARPP